MVIIIFMGKKRQVCFRLEDEILREFKKWLIDRGYRSINQYLNEHIREILSEEDKQESERSSVRSFRR